MCLKRGETPRASRDQVKHPRGFRTGEQRSHIANTPRVSRAGVNGTTDETNHPGDFPPGRLRGDNRPGKAARCLPSEMRKIREMRDVMRR